jgi:hypothetical protein
LLEHDLFRPAFARRSIKRNEESCQGLRAGGKPVPTFRIMLSRRNVMRLLFAIPILAVVGSTPAFAAEMPARKPGLWEIKMSFENPSLPAQSLKQCVEAGSDRLMPAGAASAQSNCSKRDVQRSGNTTTIEATCTLAGKTLNTRVTIAGNLDSAYTMTLTSEGDAIPGGKSTMTMSATWLGPCAAGQNPTM